MFIDIILLLLGGYVAYWGYARGLITTFFTYFSYFVAAVAVMKFARPAQDLIGLFYQGDPALTYLLGLIFALFFTILAVRLVGKAITAALETANLNLVNQLMGAGLAFFFFATLFSYTIQFFDRAGAVPASTKQDSLTYPMLEKFPSYSNAAIGFVSPYVVALWKETLDAMDGLSGTKNRIEQTESKPQIYEINEDE